MSDETTTRVEDVTASFEAAVAQYGIDNYNKIALSVLKDISISVAMLVDAGESTT